MSLFSIFIYIDIIIIKLYYVSCEIMNRNWLGEIAGIRL